MKTVTFPLLALVLLVSCSGPAQKSEKVNAHPELSRAELMNKIKGGWAGQVIGCTFGGPTEFGYQGTMIQDYQPILWDSTRIAHYFERSPGLYDDVYMDITFIEVMNKEGIDAPATSHAKAFAHAPYPLWHANQAARHNILNGLQPPESGYWMNNPHSEDIDFQIESDFAGLMSPGMPNAAAEVCDRVGHIMNYGEGWYGGVYMAALYSLAFISQDIEFVVEEALKVIPAGSNFNQCMRAVIEAYHQDPTDWKAAWFRVERDWAADIGCPEGIFDPFNIDARVNAAYVVIGLLYGQGDFTRTLEISTRCGQDSDCNPASAGGILGTMIGYDRIPEVWRAPLKPVENISFAYTNLSLNQVYESSFRHAQQMVTLQGGTVEGETIRVAYQAPVPVRLEQGFEGHFPVEKKRIRADLETTTELTFSGNGFIITGEAIPSAVHKEEAGVIHLEMVIDGQDPVKCVMPMNYHGRRLDVAWKFGLENSVHQVKLKILNPWEAGHVRLNDLIVFAPKPFKAAI